MRGEHVSERHLHHACDFVLLHHDLRAPVSVIRDPGAHCESRHHRADIVETSEHRERLCGNTDLLLGLPERRAQKVGVAILKAAPREGHLASMVHEVIGALGQEQVRSAVVVKQHQHDAGSHRISALVGVPAGGQYIGEDDREVGGTGWGGGIHGSRVYAGSTGGMT